MRLKLNFFLILSFLTFSIAQSQELDSISMTFQDGLVVVNYDFLDGEKDVEYELFLYGSHDNFIEPLQFVKGDIGKRIKIGKGKIIYWDAKKELGNFKGDFSLKIRGTKYIPLATYLNIHPDLQIKRGEKFNIEWKPNDKSKQVLLKVHRYEVPVFDPIVIDNNGFYEWEIPNRLKAGKGYAVQILDTKNLLREETSETFTVRRKIPLAFKIIPAALVGATITYFIIKDPEKGIPGPPDPPQ